MGASHGTVLILKRHEDLEEVAAYVKQQVREKSIEQVGEDLSEDDDYVGLQINEEKNEIIWHDYGHMETILISIPLQKVSSRNSLGLRWNVKAGGVHKTYGTMSS